MIVECPLAPTSIRAQKSFGDDPIGVPRPPPSKDWIRRDYVWPLLLACPNTNRHFDPYALSSRPRRRLGQLREMTTAEVLVEGSKAVISAPQGREPAASTVGGRPTGVELVAVNG